jgi:hypothetical protein
MGFVLSIFLAAASTLLAGQVKPGATSDALLLTHVNVIDTRHGLILPNMTVAVKDGTIQAVAKIGLIGGGPNLRVINATGKYLIPGLWDMHVHSAGGGGAAKPWDERILFPLYIANGITGIRDMGGDPTILEQRRKRIESGELGPHMMIAGPVLNSGQSDSHTVGVNTPNEARQAIDTLKGRGMDFVKIVDVDPGVYWVITEEAKIQHIRFAGHVPTGVSASEASVMGQASIENLSGVVLGSSSEESQLRQKMLEAVSKKDWTAYSQALGRAMDTYSASKAWDLFGQFVDNCTWQVPTLVWDVAQANLDHAEIAQDPRMKYVPASLAKRWASAKLAEETEAVPLAQRKSLAAEHMKIAGLMRRAGVFLMTGTDSPDPYVFPGFSLHDELELLVKAGWTTTQALQAATFNPALFLTKLDRYGVVEEGHAADLVLLDDDPLKDISNTRKISAVILGGRYFGRDELDKVLEQAEGMARSE